MNEIQLEKIVFEPGKSFRIFSPRLRNTFFWHYHPEAELVYVEADAGIRHVGTHISSYTQSDLVFLGGNLPHLNFDYRLRHDYDQIVIQLKTDFLGTAIGIAPELNLISGLFKAGDYGIAFHGATKEIVAQKLKQMNGLDHFEQLLQIINLIATHRLGMKHAGFVRPVFQLDQRTLALDQVNARRIVRNQGIERVHHQIQYLVEVEGSADGLGDVQQHAQLVYNGQTGRRFLGSFGHQRGGPVSSRPRSFDYTC